MTEKKDNKWGGVREGQGRPAGSKNKKTKQKEEIQKDFVARILRNANKLFNTQMLLAGGCSYLFKKEPILDNKDKVTGYKTILVTDTEEMKLYLDDEVEDSSIYYYITTKKPDQRAIESLLDRAFGRAKQDIEFGGDISVSNYDKLDDEELAKRIRELTGGSGKTPGEEV